MLAAAVDVLPALAVGDADAAGAVVARGVGAA